MSKCGVICKFLLAVLSFSILVFILNYLSSAQGFKLNGEWTVTSGNGDSRVINVPFYEVPERSQTFIVEKEFGQYHGDTLILPGVANHGMKIYLNGVFLKEIGDFRSGTANIWNLYHLIRFDSNLLASNNLLRIEMKGTYDIGIQKIPYITDYSLVKWKNIVLNLLSDDFYYISIGSGILLGILMLVLGRSGFHKDRYFLDIAISAFLVSIFLMEFVYRETTGNYNDLLVFRKIAYICGHLSLTFLSLGIERYMRKKPIVSKIIFLICLVDILILISAPDLITLKKTTNYTNILIALSSILVVLRVIIGKEKRLVFSMTFLSATIVYTINAVMSSNSGFFVANYGVLVSLIGFGMAITENYREMHKTVELAHKRSLTDPLTGSYNRGILQEVSISKRDTTVMIDIDDFKWINDKYGHEAGDIVLEKLVRVLHDNTRNEDIIIRYGGDEFLLIIKNISPTGINNIMKRITMNLENLPYCPKISYGIATGYSDPQKAIIMADSKMYEMKSGKTFS